MLKATVNGLKNLRRPEDVARIRGLTISQVLPVAARSAPRPRRRRRSSRSRSPQRGCDARASRVMAKVKITQVRSQIGQTQRHRGTLRALGLGKIGRTRRARGRPGARRYAQEGPPPREGRGREVDGRRPEPLEPEARPGAQGAQARRPRPGLGQGPLLRPRDQGPEVARRARTPCAPASRAARCRRTCAWASSAARPRRTRCRSARSARHVWSVNVRDLERGSTPAPRSRPRLLKEAGLIRNLRRDVKVLGHGDLT